MRICKIQLLTVLSVLCLSSAGCSGKASELSAGTERQAESQTTAESVKAETAAPVDVVQEGMTPVRGDELKDGVYPIQVDSSSSMFRVTECRLTVSDGAMHAVMTMSGTGYLKLYMGTGAEAQKAPDGDFIPYVENAEGAHTFDVPVEALDMGIQCSAFSRKKETWYDRILVFRADSLPAEAFAEGSFTDAESLGLEDGTYTAEVSLGGGSGRAAVESPAQIQVKNGKAFARIVWGSSNYDYMKVDGEKFSLITEEGNSAFEIPVDRFDRAMPVIADTIAMSVPYEIEYTLTFDSGTLKKEERAADWNSMKPVRSMELSYATQFSVDYYDGGCAMITIQDTRRYLVVPEQEGVFGERPEQEAASGGIPANLPPDVTVVRQPVDNIYLAATSAMDLFRSLDAIDRITLSGTAASGWYIEEARQAMENGAMEYAGKYNAPDYERILSKGCGLAVESTMIYHSPEVKEQLEQLGIPVLVERSSYEPHPLGRMEWVKLYAALLGEEDRAEALFAEQIKHLESIAGQEATGKTVAFFYISSNGYANVRKPGDYVAKMIGLAGGSYVPGDLSENGNALSTMNMQMEAFYAAARDADYIIYNSAIDGELKGLDDLLGKSVLLADFKAVKEGHVWCTGKNMFQETMGLADMILDIHKILTEDKPDPSEMTYLYPLV